MNKITSIHFKAAFLLVVFSLNTLVGFACSMGLDMGFNTSHHNDEAIEPSVHIHTDGKKHHHQPEPAKVNVHIHAGGKKHEHKTETAKQHHEKKETQKKDKDDCCNDDVLKFQSLDKNLNKNVRAAINAPALVAIISIFVGVDMLKASAELQSQIHRYLFPPPPDILISIQRFQI
jgi:hypothetical protein